MSERKIDTIPDPSLDGPRHDSTQALGLSSPLSTFKIKVHTYILYFHCGWLKRPHLYYPGIAAELADPHF
jgi:hypothetical protein